MIVGEKLWFRLFVATINGLSIFGAAAILWTFGRVPRLS